MIKGTVVNANLTAAIWCAWLLIHSVSREEHMIPKIRYPFWSCGPLGGNGRAYTLLIDPGVRQFGEQKPLSPRGTPILP